MTHARDRQSGSVLVLSLLVIATLTGLAVAFSGTARTEVNLAAFSRDALRAEALARAGVQGALQAIASDEDVEKDDLGEDWALFDPTALPMAVPPEAVLTGFVRDEAGKLNLNMLLNGSGEIDEAWGQRVERLFDLLGLSRVAYESLLDWLDSDDIKRLDGAESFTYQGQEVPYPCANGPLLSPRQVRLVQGFDRTDRLGGGADLDLMGLVTVYGDGRINVNTAPPEVLQSLDEELDRSLAESMVFRRTDEPFESVSEVKEVPGMDEEVFERVQGLLTVNSSLFGILFEGRWDETVCRIHAVAERTEKGVRLISWKVE